jgi:hypothetical protein
MSKLNIILRLSLILLFFFFFSPKGNGQLISYGGGFNISNGTIINIDKYDEDYYTSSYGVHLKTSYKLDYKLRLVPKLAFFFPRTKDLEGGEATTMLTDLNVNIYKINNPRDLIRTYIFGGVNFSGWYLKDDSKNPENEINLKKYGLYPGVSAGAGFKFNIKHDMELFIEGKYLQYLTVMSGQVMGLVGVNMILD